MHTTKHILVLFASLGLIGAYEPSGCDPDKDAGDWEPYPVEEEIPILFCQEACDADADCGAGAYCSDDTFRCVDCKADANCTNPLAPFCVDGSCLSCRDDADCPGTAPRCLDGTCTCSATAQCEPDERCMYTTDAARVTSVPGCVCWENSACAGIGPEVCIAGICIECDFDAHCGANGTCFEPGTLYSWCGCANDAGCGPGAPHCIDGDCYECLDNAECTTECVDNSCAECADDADCPAAAPWCVGNACVECRGEPREGTAETQAQVDTDCPTLGLGDECVDNACSCSAASTCTAAVTPGFAWVCEE
jgi:hypothetical protein